MNKIKWFLLSKEEKVGWVILQSMKEGIENLDPTLIPRVFSDTLNNK